VFMFPIMRQLMAWIGTMPASPKSIHKILSRGRHCAIIPGGIAEMYLSNFDTEEVYLKKRRNTVKIAIKEGVSILPLYFFGNTKLFSVVGANGGTDSLLARFSRSLRASVMFFYGRYYLPIPYRHPIHMVGGMAVEVKQMDEPTEEYIDDVMARLMASLTKVYEEKKPAWEQRPLVIK